MTFEKYLSFFLVKECAYKTDEVSALLRYCEDDTLRNLNEGIL
jgi:hypothetical protein